MKDYSPDLQKLFLEMMLQDAQNFIRVQNIYDAENFDRSLRSAAEFIRDHASEYKTLPTRDQVKAACGIELREVPDIGEGHNEWFLNEFESFIRRQRTEKAILQAADMIEKGDYGPVEKLIKDAVQTSLTKDMGTNYFHDARGAIESYYDNGGQVSTGWPSLDKVLYGGFSRGQLNIFAGGSGSGKSLVMMNMALNWLQQGLSGVYISLELSEELCTLRTTAMLASMGTKDIRKDLDTATMKVNLVGKKSGRYQIKALPAQSNINDIRAYLKEVQIQTGMRVDFVMVDYLDLLMPVSAKVSPNDLFVKDKYVSEELRNLSDELNILLVTASQLNRSAVEEIEFDHSHISGGISKINTADNVFGIFTSRAMRERGRYQIQAMKTRSSNGVGQKIDLAYDIETMRITDTLEQTDGEDAPRSLGSSILGQIKPKSNLGLAETVNSDNAETPKVSAAVQSNKLQSMLNSLKAKQE